MVSLSSNGLALLGLFAAIWLGVALWATLRGARLSGRAGAELDSAARAGALLAASPAIALVAYRDGRIEGSDRLAGSLGLAAIPDRLDGLAGDGAGLEPEDLDTLTDHIAQCAASAGRFTLPVRAIGSSRVLLVGGGPAPYPYPPASVLLWFVDATEGEEQRAALQADVGRLTTALDSLSALIEAAPFPMWHRGPDLRLALVNSAYVAGVEAEDAMAVIKAGIELVDESEGRSPLSQAASVRDKGETIARTVPATIAGERRMMRVVEVPLGATGVAGYAIDVEDREQARTELARFIGAQRDMLDRLSAGVAQFGVDRSLTFFNQPFARLFALAPEWLTDSPEFDRVIDGMREGGNLPEVRDFPDWKGERRGWFTNDGAAEEDWLLPGGKHLRVVAQPLPDGGLVLIFEDRTEQIQLASARDTLLRVRTATFDNLFEAVGVFASDGRLHLWNNRFRDIWQFEEEELARHPRVDAMTPHLARKLKNPNHAGLVRELVRSATVDRKQRTGRVSLIDGRDFQFAAVPLPDGNALFTMLDITDSLVIQAALRERNEALVDADRLKTAFVSNMSYELRTPLTTIAGFAEMLAGGYVGKLEPTAAEYVTAILSSVARLGALIDNVLDLTQSDTGSLLLEEDQIDLCALCREAAEEVSDAATAKAITFTPEIDESVGSINGDPRRLRQALDNILKNALAYTHEEGKVTLHADGNSDEAVISITDNGPGISLADQARVFDRFHRTMVAAGGKDPSLGLGLPLALQFVEAHGGTIDLHSELGVGTTVTVRLPRRHGLS